MTSDRQHRAEVNRLKWELRNLKNDHARLTKQHGELVKAWSERRADVERLRVALDKFAKWCKVIAEAEALFALPLPEEIHEHDEPFCEPELIAVYRRVTAEILTARGAS